MPAMARLAAAVASSLQLASGQDVVYLGSGACDGDDPSCTNDPQAQKELHAVSVRADGKMQALPKLAVSQAGLPAWLTPHGECMFVMQPDLDSVLPFKVGPDGELAPVESSWSGGKNPVHASVSADGNFLVVANYDGPDDASKNNGATVASLRIGDDCRVSVVDWKNHSGHSVIPSRQGAAHVHSVYTLRNGFIYSCDLGLDRVFTYQLASDGKLQELSRAITAPGLGPRHLAQHPTLPILYVLCEMGQVVLTYSMQDRGSLALLQTSTLLPTGASGEGSKAAEIAVLQDGSAVYATNRGKLNTITVFNPDRFGLLTFAQQVEAPVFPRGMAIASEGKVLLAAGQSKTELWSYTVGDEGKLTLAAKLTHRSDLAANPAAFAVLPRGVPSPQII